jgi:hypothetical protein
MFAAPTYVIMLIKQRRVPVIGETGAADWAQDAEYRHVGAECPAKPRGGMSETGGAIRMNNGALHWVCAFAC